jgi:5,10-methylenetetrahydromethanopterin reductase
VRDLLGHIDAGARRTGRDPAALDTWKLIGLATSHDGKLAREVQHRHVTMYLGQQPHIGKAAGLDQSFLDRVKETMGGWPPRPGGIEAAMELVSPDIVDMLTVCGTPEECRRKLRTWLDLGVQNISIGPKTDCDQALEEFAPARLL